MDAGFDEDEAEFGVFIFAVAFEVFADGDGLVIISHITLRQYHKANA